VYICGTPYVCLSIIILYTPAVADVTRTANRERVPNGALPKFGEGSYSLMGKAIGPAQEEKNDEEMSIVVISSCEPACCR